MNGRPARLAAALALWLGVALRTTATPVPPIDPDLARWTAALLDDLAAGAIEWPDEDDWRLFGRQIEACFETGSLDELAWLLPEARRTLALCDRSPALRPYGDWLRQRVDYLEVADRLVRALPPKQAPPPCPPAPFLRKRLPPPPPVEPTVAAKRKAAVRSRSLWLETLAHRPLPKGGAKLVPVVKKVFEAEGLPHQLVWIAEVESSFNPLARSPAGAVGLFQLMPETAKRMGLSLAPEDQRQSAAPSAGAAARYLRFLYGEFGTWPLALAAYNCGEGRLGRVLGKRKKPAFDEIADALPLQTRLYVPKVLALIELREKIDPVRLPAPKPRSASP